MSQIKFTVIMPCYNSALFIKDAIDSLLNQKYENWELIAVNDGSTDNTLEILNSYADNDKRIRVFSKENGGYSTAINYGLSRVCGDYFLMMGSDDRLSFDLFYNIIEKIKNIELPDMIGFRAIRCISRNVQEIDAISNFDTLAYMYDTTINEFEKIYQKHSKILFIRDTAKCFKTSLLGDLMYFGKYGYDADGVFSSLFAHKCRSFLCIPLVGYFWTIRESSVSATCDTNKNLDRIKVWAKYVIALKRNPKIRLTMQEKRYVFYTIKVSIELLDSGSKLCCKDYFIMNKAMRASLVFAEKQNLDLGIYVMPKNKIKRIIYLLFPVLWLKRHGFLARK